MPKVEWTKKATTQLFSIDTRYRKRIRDKADDLENFPNVNLDIKKLHGDKRIYRLRIGDYRLIFEIFDGEPVICEIQMISRRTTTTYKGR